MERCLFNDLVALVQKVWDADMGSYATISSKQASCSSGSPVTMTTRVAVTLRWLAGGNYWDICGLFGIAAGCFLILLFFIPPLLYLQDKTYILETCNVHWMQVPLYMIGCTCAMYIGGSTTLRTTFYCTFDVHGIVHYNVHCNEH